MFRNILVADRRVADADRALDGGDRPGRERERPPDPSHRDRAATAGPAYLVPGAPVDELTARRTRQAEAVLPRPRDRIPHDVPVTTMLTSSRSGPR